MRTRRRSADVLACFLMGVVVLVATGCATSPEQHAAESTNVKPCNREATTGSHIPRCDEGVAGVTRELPPLDPGPVVFPQRPRVPGTGI